MSKMSPPFDLVVPSLRGEFGRRAQGLDGHTGVSPAPLSYLLDNATSARIGNECGFQPVPQDVLDPSRRVLGAFNELWRKTRPNAGI